MRISCIYRSKNFLSNPPVFRFFLYDQYLLSCGHPKFKKKLYKKKFQQYLFFTCFRRFHKIFFFGRVSAWYAHRSIGFERLNPSKLCTVIIQVCAYDRWFSGCMVCARSGFELLAPTLNPQ